MNIQLQILNFPAQQQIFDAPQRYKIAAKGRRFGITKGAANDYIRSALQRTFKRGLWVDTVNTNIDRYIERYFMPHLVKLPKEIWSWRRQDKLITLYDSYIDFRSSDRPENIEGFGYDKFFINEAGIVLKNEYLWNNAIRPMLWDYKASGVIGGTPKGKGVFCELFNRGKDKEQTDFASFRFSTFDNPYVEHAQIREDIRSMPERVIKQEIYAEFLDDAGVVFQGFQKIATAIQKSSISDHLYVIGADLARLEDFTVLVVYDRKTNEQVFQMRFNNLDWGFVKNKIKEVSRLYNNALVLLDATGIGDPIYDDLSRDGVPIEPIKFTNTIKKQLIEKLANWIELSRIRILNLEETLQEFGNFTYDFSSTGKVRYEAPVGFHDDIVIAHALAVWSLQPIVESKKDNLTIIQRDMQEKILGNQYEDYQYI